MSNTEISKMNVSRRTFLKTSAIAAGSTWLASSLGCSSGASSETDTAPVSADQIFKGVCRPNCFAGCPLDVTVREGKLVKTAAADYPDPQFNRICLRGMCQVDNVYATERVLYPMKRAGERGEDKWEQITWEEAISEIAEKWQGYSDEFGPESNFKYTISGNYGVINGGFYDTLFGAMNFSSVDICLDMGNAVGFNRVAGWAGIWCSSEAADLVNAKNIFVWGNNITDAQIHEWHFVADAKEAGAKLIVIDPTFTQLAAKADMFVSIRPASDAALILSMMNVIIAEDLIDKDYMTKHTVAPFLVRDDTGMFLRMSDLGVAPTEGPVNPATGEATEIDPVAVWNPSTNAVVVQDSVEAPALEGSFTANGIACKTAFTLLKAECDKYTPEYASTICDVPVEIINELAHLAVDGPVTHRVGWGPQAYNNGVHPHHAGGAMAAITGMMGDNGKCYGPANWDIFSGFNTALTAKGGVATSPKVAVMELPNVIESGTFKGEPLVPKSLYIYMGNPVNTASDANRMIEKVFKKIEFIVTADSVMTDTARWSDIVLPSAQFFEYEDVCGRGQDNFIKWNQKCIDPPGEVKPDTEIVRMLAEALGFSDLFPATDQEWLAEYMKSDACEAIGLSYETLSQGVPIRYAGEVPMVRWRDGVFLTASGKMEFYVEKPTAFLDQGQTIDIERERLPRFFEPNEAWPTNPLAAQYPYVLMSERPRFRVHSQYAYNKILRELDPEPTVKMNPADAASKGFENGDYVECFNDRGHAVAKLSVNDAIRPGTMVYPKSWESKQHLAGTWSELTSMVYDPVMVNQNFMDVLVDVKSYEGGN